MANTLEIKAQMVRMGFTQKEVADKLGMSEKTFCGRLKNGVFRTDEAEKLITLLNIENPALIFFDKK